MSKVRRNNNIGRELTELRRSHAAGIHEKNTPRNALTRRAIQMSILDGETGFSPDDIVGPSPEEIALLEEEYLNSTGGHPELSGYYDLLNQYGIDENDIDNVVDEDTSDLHDKEYDVP